MTLGRQGSGSLDATRSVRTRLTALGFAAEQIVVAPARGVLRLTEVDLEPASFQHEFGPLVQRVQRLLGGGRGLSLYVTGDRTDALARQRAAVQLALGAVPAGGTVVLVDADFLKPGLGGILADPYAEGLVDMVWFGRSTRSLLLRPVPEGPWLLPSGSFPADEPVPISADALRSVVYRVSQVCDLALYVGPLPVRNELHPLARVCDHTIYAGSTDAGDDGARIAEALAALERQNAHVAGVVVYVPDAALALPESVAPGMPEFTPGFLYPPDEPAPMTEPPPAGVVPARTLPPGLPSVGGGPLWDERPAPPRGPAGPRLAAEAGALPAPPPWEEQPPLFAPPTLGAPPKLEPLPPLDPIRLEPPPPLAPLLAARQSALAPALPGPVSMSPPAPPAASASAAPPPPVEPAPFEQDVAPLELPPLFTPAADADAAPADFDAARRALDEAIARRSRDEARRAAPAGPAPAGEFSFEEEAAPSRWPLFAVVVLVLGTLAFVVWAFVTRGPKEIPPAASTPTASSPSSPAPASGGPTTGGSTTGGSATGGPAPGSPAGESATGGPVSDGATGAATGGEPGPGTIGTGAAPTEAEPDDRAAAGAPVPSSPAAKTATPGPPSGMAQEAPARVPSIGAPPSGVTPPPSTTADGRAPAAPPSGAAGAAAGSVAPEMIYAVHVASYEHLSQAERDIANLRRNGYEARAIETDLGSKGMWFRVYVVGWETREEAAAARERLLRLPGYDFAQVRRLPRE